VRSAVGVGPSREHTKSATPTSSDEALKLAIKLAVDAGEYERATALIEVAKRIAEPANVATGDAVSLVALHGRAGR
jgi:hypothetical protein